MTQQRQPRSFWIGPDGPPKYIWASDRLVPWDEATVHASMLGWSSISMVFEGIRGYWNPAGEQLNVFHLEAHMRRLLDSMKIMRMTSRWSVDDLVKATADLLAANELRSDAYIQPLAYFDGGIPGYSPVIDQPGEVIIFSRPIISFLESDRALNCGFVTWQRLSDNVMPPRAKAVSNYQNARYMSNEARLHGYDYAISLNQDGKVSELSHACVFVVRDGVAATPPVTAGVLESITVGGGARTARRHGGHRRKPRHRQDGALRGGRGVPGGHRAGVAGDRPCGRLHRGQRREGADSGGTVPAVQRHRARRGRPLRGPAHAGVLRGWGVRGCGVTSHRTGPGRRPRYPRPRLGPAPGSRRCGPCQGRTGRLCGPRRWRCTRPPSRARGRA